MAIDIDNVAINILSFNDSKFYMKLKQFQRC
jgi:hypothetical protein